MTTVLGNFGRLVISTDIDAAVMANLQRWMPTYLRQISTERGLPAPLATPSAGSYMNAINIREAFDHPLPAVVVTTAQIAEKPHRISGGYSAAWRSNVNVVTKGRTAPETRLHAALYEGCVRRIMLEQPDPTGLIADVIWMPSAGVVAIPDVSRQARYLAAGQGSYDVFVDMAVELSDAAPTVPDAGTYLPSIPVVEIDFALSGFAPNEQGGPA